MAVVGRRNQRVRSRMTGQRMADAVTGDHSTDSLRRRVQLHLQAEHRKRREGGKAKKSAGELHRELQVDLRGQFWCFHRQCRQLNFIA